MLDTSMMDASQYDRATHGQRTCTGIKKPAHGPASPPAPASKRISHSPYQPLQQDPTYKGGKLIEVSNLMSDNEITGLLRASLFLKEC